MPVVDAITWLLPVALWLWVSGLIGANTRRSLTRCCVVFTLATLALLALQLWSGRDWHALGLGWPSELHPARAWSGLALAAVWAVGLALYLRADYRHTLTCPDCQRDHAEEIAKLPVRDRSLVWIAGSAGVTEEILCRGLLAASSLAWLTPRLGDVIGTTASVLLTSMMFGLLHWNPRRRNLDMVLWSAAAGAVLSGLTLFSGSIYGAILTHVAQNTLVMTYRIGLVRALAPRPDTDPR